MLILILLLLAHSSRFKKVPVIKNNRKMLTHRAYTSTKATTLAEIRPRRPFNAEIPEDDGVDVGVPEFGSSQ